MRTIALVAAIFCAVFSSSAEAKRHPHRPAQPACEFAFFCPPQMHQVQPMGLSRLSGGAARSIGLGPRPRQWCGWFMQKDTGITSRGTGLNLNMARSWARVGTASSPHIGAIVVWARGRGGHVGKIVGGSPGRWVVRSGNDSRAVRERVRNVANAIAIRSL